MKSIKPGRGPSLLSAISGICATLFGVFWCIMAASMGAFFMLPFGMIFIFMTVVIVVYNYRNATRKDRYSSFDITDSNEEADPLNVKYGQKHSSPGKTVRFADGERRFCTYCGCKIEEGWTFCSNCGANLKDK